jgi:nucleoid DNA-binding protein
MAKATATAGAKKAPSKTEVLANISDATEVSKKDVAKVIDALGNEIKKALSNKGPGMFAIPGLVKIIKQKVPAKPARKGVPNPFKPGELMDVPAKPATVKVKVRALKNLKDMVK